MKKIKTISPIIFLIVIFVGISKITSAQKIFIKNNQQKKEIEIANDKIWLVLNYDKKTCVTSLNLNGQQVIESNTGMYSSIRTKDKTFSTLQLKTNPIVSIKQNEVSVQAIKYGDEDVIINETWHFTVHTADIKFKIDRSISKSIVAEQITFPTFVFKNINTWEGAYQDYGGIAWFYLFNKPLDTYGVHSSSSQFWNSKTGNGLNISVQSTGNAVAMDYSRTEQNELEFKIAIAKGELLPRFDSGTNRRRYIRDRTDIWAPVVLNAGKTSQQITLEYFDYQQQFDRGNLVGLNAPQVNAVLNTIARIGVIDKNHFGGNSWHTPYGPICLHEQYIAQMGLGINDKKYLKGYQDCLNFYRDNAIKEDGRVWPRWAYSNEDAMPGIYTDKGFYEAQWGYLLDANPDYVTNVAELYDQIGDINWIKTQQTTCEKALDWIMNRDSNQNGLVEMVTDNHNQKRGSDWIDIIWASYENAFVNAKLYRALVLWAAIEKQLGNSIKEKYYQQFAEKLKINFNKLTTSGGFWDEEKKCYVHWRDKDGSIHGNNLVTPVNFMAIAYGICEDTTRIKNVLDGIENQMLKEKLFFWPICMYSYKEGEGNDWQFPFPNYENGDIFLSWGSVGVKAYASYNPDLALKYVRNVLEQYGKDGLAFQRYGRAKQEGLGDDILSGNSLAIVGLYQSIYGINPLYNRIYINPHITKDLAGTSIKYNYRNKQLTINLDIKKYTVADQQFTLTDNNDFGFFSTENELLYFNGNNIQSSLNLKTSNKTKITLNITNWNNNEMSWIQSYPEKKLGIQEYHLYNLEKNSQYNIFVNQKLYKSMLSDPNGSLNFSSTSLENVNQFKVIKKIISKY